MVNGKLKIYSKLNLKYLDNTRLNGIFVLIGYNMSYTRYVIEHNGERHSLTSDEFKELFK